MTFDYQAARLTMVESQVRTNDVTDLTLQDAMRLAPRETLLPPQKALTAYADTEIEYAPGRYLMRPRDVAKLLQALKPVAGEKALAIGAPYAAMVLGLMGLTVDQIEVDGQPQGAYDVIITEGAVAEVPAAWTAALADRGRLGVVVRETAAGKARIYVSTDGRVAWREVFDSHPPYAPGMAPKAQFAF
ncbi:MAG TPA: protein-L-isoaspartate O-methyltransferase [Caulobacteraceae bacterium]|nr:protein-L-isoaspartate O-methyltransferase [Caulobacteraceae bacterium]